MLLVQNTESASTSSALKHWRLQRRSPSRSASSSLTRAPEQASAARIAPSLRIVFPPKQHAKRLVAPIVPLSTRPAILRAHQLSHAPSLLSSKAKSTAVVSTWHLLGLQNGLGAKNLAEKWFSVIAHKSNACHDLT